MAATTSATAPTVVAAAAAAAKTTMAAASGGGGGGGGRLSTRLDDYTNHAPNSSIFLAASHVFRSETLSSIGPSSSSSCLSHFPLSTRERESERDERRKREWCCVHSCTLQLSANNSTFYPVQALLVSAIRTLLERRL